MHSGCHSDVIDDWTTPFVHAHQHGYTEYAGHLHHETTGLYDTLHVVLLREFVCLHVTTKEDDIFWLDVAGIHLINLFS
jgi:hypothetical protein